KLAPGDVVAPRKEESSMDPQERVQPPVAPPRPGVAPLPLTPLAGGKLHVWSLGSVTVEMRTTGPLSSKQVERLRKYVDLAMDAEEDEQSAVSDSVPSERA